MLRCGLALLVGVLTLSSTPAFACPLPQPAQTADAFQYYGWPSGAVDASTDLHTWYGLPYRVTNNGHDVFVAVTLPLKRWERLVARALRSGWVYDRSQGPAQFHILAAEDQPPKLANVVARHLDRENMLITHVLVLPIGFAPDRVMLTWGVDRVEYRSEIELRRTRTLSVPRGETRCVSDWFDRDDVTELKDVTVEQRGDRLCASASLFGTYTANSSVWNAPGGTFRHDVVVSPSQGWGWRLLLFALFGGVLGFLLHLGATRTSRARYVVFREDPRASFRGAAKPRLIAKRVCRALRDIHPRFSCSTVRFSIASSRVRVLGSDVVAKLPSGHVDLLTSRSTIPIGTVLRVTSEVGEEDMVITNRRTRDEILSGALPFPTIPVVDVQRARLWPAVQHNRRPTEFWFLSVFAYAAPLAPIMCVELWRAFGDLHVASGTTTAVAAAITFTAHLLACRERDATTRAPAKPPVYRTAAQWRAEWMRRLR